MKRINAKYIERHLPKETGWKAYVYERNLRPDNADPNLYGRSPQPDDDETLIIEPLDPKMNKDYMREYTDFNSALNFISDFIFSRKPYYSDQEYEAKVSAFEEIKNEIMCGQEKLLLKDLFKDIELYGLSEDSKYYLHDEVIILQGNMRKCTLPECEINIFAHYLDMEADIDKNVVRVFRSNKSMNLFCFSISKKADPDGAKWVAPDERL